MFRSARNRVPCLYAVITKTPPEGGIFDGGHWWDRTTDLTNVNRAL